MNDEKASEVGLMSTPDSMAKLLEEITPAVYETLRTAIELGRWSDGNKLTSEQLENCLQAIILYENEHMQEADRTGALLGGCKTQIDS